MCEVLNRWDISLGLSTIAANSSISARCESRVNSRLCFLEILAPRPHFSAAQEEMETVATFIKKKGRITIADLCAQSNSLIKLTDETKDE